MKGIMALISLCTLVACCVRHPVFDDPIKEAQYQDYRQQVQRELQEFHKRLADEPWQLFTMLVDGRPLDAAQNLESWRMLQPTLDRAASGNHPLAQSFALAMATTLAHTDEATELKPLASAWLEQNKGTSFTRIRDLVAIVSWTAPVVSADLAGGGSEDADVDPSPELLAFLDAEPSHGWIDTSMLVADALLLDWEAVTAIRAPAAGPEIRDHQKDQVGVFLESPVVWGLESDAHGLGSLWVCGERDFSLFPLWRTPCRRLAQRVLDQSKNIEAINTAFSILDAINDIEPVLMTVNQKRLRERVAVLAQVELHRGARDLSELRLRLEILRREGTLGLATYLQARE